MMPLHHHSQAALFISRYVIVIREENSEKNKHQNMRS